jgi:hypothetical protein
MTLSFIKDKYEPKKYINNFFETCQLSCKNMKFGSSSSHEETCLET